MTREMYLNFMVSDLYISKHERCGWTNTKHDDSYKGKHEQHEYTVWRVLGPAGPTETVKVKGKEELREALIGTWDAEIRDEKGYELSQQALFPKDVV